jgi:hypothetical protein
MVIVLPSPRSIERLDDDVTPLATLAFDLTGADLAGELIEQRLGDLLGLHVAFAPEGAPQPAVNVVVRQETSFLQSELADFQRDEAYTIVAGERVTIRCAAKQGFLNALATLKRLLTRRDAFVLRTCGSPTIRTPRSLGLHNLPLVRWLLESRLRLSALGLEGEGVHRRSDFKSHAVNMCMYGYWPFRFDEFPRPP